MPTLPDLFERLAEHGEHAGADAVVERALRAAHTAPMPTLLTPSDSPHRSRRLAPALVAAMLTVALIAVPLAVRVADRAPRASREPAGPPYASPAAATVDQISTWHWSRVAAPPPPVELEAANQVVAWAGDELVVFGEDLRHENPYGAGAAYSPTTGRWRVLPKAPLKGQWFFAPSWVWTGRELVVFPTTLPDAGEPRGEAYSPRTNSWRALAPAPLCTVAQAGIVWTGRAIVVAGGYNVAGSQCSDARAAHSASYDPRTDRWTRGPKLPVRSGDRLEVTRLVWVAGRVVAIVASQRGGAASPTTTPSSPTTTVAAGSRTLTGTTLLRNDPIVRGYTLVPGGTAWHALGDVTRDTAGESSLEHWTAYSDGTRAVFPPSLRFCGEGNDGPCSVAGVQPGSVVDIATGARTELIVPQLAYANNVDATAFTGASLIAWIHAGSTAPTFAWDLATGRRITVPAAPGDVFTTAWTGTEIFAVATRPSNQGLLFLRFGP